MKTLNIYCNYGVLNAEKMKIYTYGCKSESATISDILTVVVPDGWDIYIPGVTATQSPSLLGDGYTQ